MAQKIDDAVLSNYKLWPTNFIAYDIVHKTSTYSHMYTESEKSLFERRLEMRIGLDNPIAFEGFLAMYANPVVNKLNAQIENSTSNVYLFGAHIFSQYLFAFGLESTRIKCILDNSPLKQGKRLYGSNLLVNSPKVLEMVEKPIIILKAGLYNKEIKEDILENINSTAIFI